MESNQNPDEAVGAAGPTPAGWFDDPHGQHDLRYWDGSAWSEHVHDREAAAVPPPATTQVAAVGHDGRKWGVIIAVILLIGAVILAATSLSGNDSNSVVDDNQGSVAGVAANPGDTGLSNGDATSNDPSGPASQGNSPQVVYTASVESANSGYGGISDQIAVAGGHVWVVSPDAVTILDEQSGEFVGSLPAGSTDAAGLFADGGRVWLVSPFTNTLTIINADTVTVDGKIVLSAGGHQPSSRILLTDGYAWVPNGNVAVSETPGTDIIEVIDKETLSVVKELEVSEGANHLLLADGRVWMVNSLSNQVTVIDVDTLSVVATITSGDFPRDITYVDGLIWVANARGATVSVIDPSSFEVIDEISVGIGMTADDQQFPGPRKIHGVDGSVWVTMSQDQSLKVIDTTTHEVVDSVPASGNWVFSDTTVWVAEGTEVSAIDLSTHQILGSASGGTEFVFDMTSTSDGVLVINEDNTLSKLTLGGG